MNVRPKRLPRLWCAMLGLLPFDVVLPGSVPPATEKDRRPSPAPSSTPEKTSAAWFRPGTERFPSKVALPAPDRDAGCSDV